jgi:hypothetical protein
MNGSKGRRLSTALAAAVVALTALSPAAYADTAPTLPPNGTKPVSASEWQIVVSSPGAKPGTVRTNDFGAGVCHGQFIGPSADITTGMTAGAFMQCLPSVTTSIQVVLNRCHRIAGPDDFDCLPVAKGRISTESATVKGTRYPDVHGNVVTVGCG